MNIALLDPQKTNKAKVGPRENRLSWDEYFMGIAIASSGRSRDPNTQVGACLVSPENRIIGVGYNGFPAGIPDDKLPWDREGANRSDTKYAFIVHAEANAILNSFGRDLRGSTLYVCLFPCEECSKIIIQAGIREIVYLSDKYAGTDGNKAAKILFDLAGVKCRKFVTDKKRIVVDLEDGQIQM